MKIGGGGRLKLTKLPILPAETWPNNRVQTTARSLRAPLAPASANTNALRLGKRPSNIEGDNPSQIDDLKTEIERIPNEEFAELLRWLSEKNSEAMPSVSVRQLS